MPRATLAEVELEYLTAGDPALPPLLLAALIPGARLHVMRGMGHDLATEFWDAVPSEITQLAARACAPRRAP